MRKIYQLISVAVLLFLIAGTSILSTANPAELPEAGTATGRIKINEQGFLMKHVYARKPIGGKEDKEKADYIILLTNRPFPEDFSKIDRLDISRYAARYDLQGLIIGVNKNRELVFADILRVRSITGSVDFKPSSNEDDLIEGRLYSNGEQHYLQLKYQIDVTFSANVKP